MALIKYQAPSLSGSPYMPPAMASFEKGHYQYNGLRGAGENIPERPKWLWGVAGAGLILALYLMQRGR